MFLYFEQDEYGNIYEVVGEDSDTTEYCSSSHNIIDKISHNCLPISFMIEVLIIFFILIIIIHKLFKKYYQKN